jgi:hypothetical protein
MFNAPGFICAGMRQFSCAIRLVLCYFGLSDLTLEIGINWD